MPMTWIIVAAVAGLLVGGGGIAAISKPAAPPVIVTPPDTTAKGQADAVAALTNLDIVKGLCAPEYIKENGDGLCREMYCLAVQLHHGRGDREDLRRHLQPQQHQGHSEGVQRRGG